ncbi:MAG: tripartite tricarboxylate transporter TctB family protein [Sphaerochaetaceae bacterium]|jgi:uncharacterized BrkB/YihY/UPF0761 family membrane protein|nr:tripartite tricarboxylate transporter TctB family protein [Sphaerochaetaceae bacterium]NLO61517.1 tripartite tricarboxylate transporter TctB family protein [Spirochaetales bacterium]MDD2406784.1 tripartite tricarboxylate transporter TctB family protein [Sphaerochaetaceae bacterium]MDD4260224.1 tripartite tricarboxylate transporter TctB family protein [Sphaerochaetaceae bacterium]MDD4763398.1 tripartite tricarboxylate transporter TctB family protein [Sphaerochaetaceae bacterium]
MTPKADFYSGIGIAVFSAVFFILSGTYPASEQGLGPGGFPKIVTGTMFCLGVLLSINSFINMKRGMKDIVKLNGKDMLQVLILAAAFLAYIVVIKYLGYVISTPLFLFLFLYLYGDRKWLRMVLVSIIGTAVTFVLFKYLFQIYLPEFYFF